MRGLRARRASPADHRSRLLQPLLALRGIPPDISGVLRTRWRRVRSGIGRRLRRSPACPRLGGIVRLGPTRRILLLAVDRRRRQPIRIRSVPPSGNRHLNPECLNLGVSERVVSQDVARIAQRSRQARATRQRGAGDRGTTRTDSNRRSPERSVTQGTQRPPRHLNAMSQLPPWPQRRRWRHRSGRSYARRRRRGRPCRP